LIVFINWSWTSIYKQQLTGYYNDDCCLNFSFQILSSWTFSIWSQRSSQYFLWSQKLNYCFYSWRRGRDKNLKLKNSECKKIENTKGLLGYYLTIMNPRLKLVCKERRNEYYLKSWLRHTKHWTSNSSFMQVYFIWKDIKYSVGTRNLIQITAAKSTMLGFVPTKFRSSLWRNSMPDLVKSFVAAKFKRNVRN